MTEILYTNQVQQLFEKDAKTTLSTIHRSIQPHLLSLSIIFSMGPLNCTGSYQSFDIFSVFFSNYAIKGLSLSLSVASFASHCGTQSMVKEV